MPLLFILILLTGLCSPLLRADTGGVDSLDVKIDNNDFSSSDVLAMVVQPDGKLIIGGDFESVLGAPRNNIARLNLDGTLDMSFDAQVDGSVACVTVLSDGKLICGGLFSSVSGVSRKNLACLNANGTLDLSFDPLWTDQVFGVTVQADGKLLIGGKRLNTDGTIDAGFDPRPNSAVRTMVVQSDGKILLGGQFDKLRPNGASPTLRSRIARVNADGTLDTGFDPNVNGNVYCIAVQADGKILIGGTFTSLQPNGAASSISRNNIARVNADGTLDTGFDPKTNGDVLSMAVQVDGRVLISGFFTTLQPNGAGVATPRKYVARLDASGALDPSFNPNVNGSVDGVALQWDGKILLGGGFNGIQSTFRNRFGRMNNDPATQTLAVPDTTQALWQRSTAAPELSRVTFELTTNGGASWISLGSGMRVGATPNWQIAGQTLPASGTLRARGTIAGGYHSGSSGVVEQSINFGVGYPFSAWKLAQLGDASAPNNGDPDLDGLKTIIEYATGGNPLAPLELPAGNIVVGNARTLTFPRNTSATDVTLVVQGSDDLATWTDLASSSGGAAMMALVPGVTVTELTLAAVRTVELSGLYFTTDTNHPRLFFRLQATPISAAPVTPASRMARVAKPKIKPGDRIRQR